MITRASRPCDVLFYWSHITLILKFMLKLAPHFSSNTILSDSELFIPIITEYYRHTLMFVGNMAICRRRDPGGGGGTDLKGKSYVRRSRPPFHASIWQSSDPQLHYNAPVRTVDSLTKIPIVLNFAIPKAHFGPNISSLA